MIPGFHPADPGSIPGMGSCFGVSNLLGLIMPIRLATSRHVIFPLLFRGLFPYTDVIVLADRSIQSSQVSRRGLSPLIRVL